jgi:predicted secreted protein
VKRSDPAGLRDARGERVVFLSHCLLNENTRYRGGAARPGCVREIIDACADAGLGIVQLPCPEEHAWGGVRKRRLLRLYGSAGWLPGRLRRLLLPALLAYTRTVYARLARDTARRVADYRRTGHEVVAVVGVDGSPSCGVARTLDIPAAVDRLARVDRRGPTSDAVNAVVRDTLVPGPGLFTEQVRRALRRRRIDVPYLAHDLLGELDGGSSPVVPQLRRAAPSP